LGGYLRYAHTDDFRGGTKAHFTMSLYGKFGRLRTRTAAFVHDLTMIPLAWMGALWLRFNLESVPETYLSAAWSALPAVLFMQGVVFWYFGLYRGVWRFASLPDLLRIVKAIAVGVCLVALGLFLATRMHGVPRSVFPLYAVLLLVLLGGPRLLYRWFKDRRIYARASRNTLVVGAGRAGEMLVRDLLRDPDFGYHPVGFIDDDNNKKGREIHGVRVLGNSSKISRLCERLNVQMVLLAIPSASSEQMRAIVEHCEQASVPMKTLPSIKDLPSGRAGLSSLRSISIEDLLGREPVSLDWQAIAAGIKGHTVLVTGGGGSIGAELCRQIGSLDPERLVIYDASEFNVYQIERELKVALPGLAVHALLGDVCDSARLEQVFSEFKPSLVLHAAAYKHVPMLEYQARQAVRNNVLGTRITAAAAIRHGCQTFVLISTDKAVNPTNVMGASKRLAEMCCQHDDSQSADTSFVIVRFGNVLDSAGSVVPLFREQIARGGPVTVTHPEVKRYFMTIPEACQLILQAAAVGNGGELFVLDMGEPVSINYLARQMILLAGKSPDADVQIQFTGLRPGEKLFEELFHPAEALRASRHEKLFLAKTRETDWSRFVAELVQLEQACDRADEEGVRRSLSILVPEFGPSLATDSNIIELNRAKR
jgi:FlaA1/EpsC-like NDP-sugar epimerase